MVVRSVNVWSVARVLGAMYAVMGLIFGGVVALVSVLGAGIAGASDAPAGAVLGAIFGVGAVVILPVFYGVIGLVFGAVSAALYNLLASVMGGIQVDLQTAPDLR